MSDDWDASSNPQSSSGGIYFNYNQQYQSNDASGGGGSSSSNAGGYYGQQQSNVPPANAFHTTQMNTNNQMGGHMMNNNPMPAMSGPMGSTPINNPSVFDPNSALKSSSTSKNAMSSYYEDYENEPPLLEELGVNFPHIYSKSRAVLFPFSQTAKTLQHEVMDDDDLAGPLAFALGLGGELLLSGKLHFGYVYGFGISGWIAMTLLLNLLNINGAVNALKVVSILGYALLPVNFLAGLNVVWRIGKMGWVGVVLAVLTIGWCTAAATRLFERGCDMRSQRFLVAYPAALLYSAFVMITIF